MTSEIFFPTFGFSLTGGPSQPEYTSFEPAGTTDMVDLFTGDFVYNIPLFEIPGPDGGYPLNLSYHSGITMDQEASWVGLGWTLNAGSMMRQLRGIPDDFNGDSIVIKRDMNPDRTWTFSGRVQSEVVGFPLGQTNAQLSLGVTNNSYRGWSIRAGIGLSTAFGANGQYVGGLGLNIDGNEGATIQPSIGIIGQSDDVKSQWKLGTSIGAYQGLQNLSLHYRSERETQKEIDGDIVTTRYEGSNYGGLNFAQRAFSPSSEIQYSGLNFSAYLSAGGKLFFVDLGGGLGVDFSSQKFRNSNRFVQYKSYGYMNLSDRTSNYEDALMDYERQRLSPITNNSPNLHVPSHNPDIFIASGQGFGGTFRFYRSDVGVMSPEKAKSTTAGARLNYEFNLGGGFHQGFDIGGNSTEIKNRIWTSHGIYGKYGFVDPVTQNPLYEPVYIKSPTQTTVQELTDYQYLNDENTTAFKLSNSGFNIKNEMDNEIAVSGQRKRQKREIRSENIQYIRNKDLLNPSNNKELSREFAVQYYSTIGELINLDRSQRNPDHLAGMTVLQSNGLRYVYALPQSNLIQEEYLYSVSDDSERLTTANKVSQRSSTTQGYLEQKQLPRYEQNFLLTSVVGDDYLDCDGIPGVSSGDQGYWIKFSYKKTEDSPWRAPFTEANLLRGILAVELDNKASFVYGVREQYYLAKIESRTHVAEFYTSLRDDAQSPGSIEPSNNFDRIKTAYRLDSMQLRTQSSISELLKTVVFSYDYSLGSQVPNSQNGKKLTLKSLYINNDNSTRGSLSPYIFSYSDDDIAYEHGMYDRWGQVSEKNIPRLLDAPYTEQGRLQDDNTEDVQIRRDRLSSLWHLQGITLPSGAEIEVEYEADDYAYVQDRVAMQMMYITNSSFTSNKVTAGSDDLKVYFDPEYPVSTRNDVRPYLEDLHGIEFDENGNIVSDETQVFFSVRSEILNSSQPIQTKGYALVEDYGVDQGAPYLLLKPTELGKNGNNKSYHPIPSASWVKIKSQIPQALTTEDLDYDESGLIDAVGNFISALPDIINVFDSYFRYCSDNAIGSKVIEGHSFVRLCTPDKKKYGGGTRVKKITIDDHWHGDVLYGTTYEYTKVEEGKIISSGVAQNEPSVGSEESALKFAKVYTETSFLKSPRPNFFEYPINESYFPGASVGYSQVTVKSIATEQKRGFSPTGETVYEFYTARDFPTLVKETILGPSKKRYSSELAGNITSLLFNVRKDQFVGSQGYSITLNDMHGKPSRVSHYAVDEDYNRAPAIVNEVRYNYHEDEQTINYSGVGARLARTVSNKLPVLDYLPQEVSSSSEMISDKLIGQSIELIIDLVDNKSESIRAGWDFNADLTIFGLFFIIPTGFGMPQFASNTTITRTAVTNKIIRKKGILRSVETFDGQSELVTTHELYDKLTGRPILTSVNDHFDNKIYQWNIPAHYCYDGMSAASRNWGLSIEVDVEAINNSGYWTMSSNSLNLEDIFFRGDELLVQLYENSSDPSPTNGLKAYVQEFDGGEVILAPKNNNIQLSSNTRARVYVHKSGYRNQLKAVASSISTSNIDPTKSWDSQTVNKNIPGPSGLGNRSIKTVLLDSVLNASSRTFTSNFACDACEKKCYTLELDLIGSEFIDSLSDFMYGKVSISHPDSCFNGPYDISSGPNSDFDQLLEDLKCFFSMDPEVTVSGSSVDRIIQLNCLSDYLSAKNGVSPFRIAPCLGRCPSNLYSEGKKGIWRPFERYEFIKDRLRTQEGQELDLSSEDKLDDFVLFDHCDPLFEELSYDFGWIASNSIQNYSTGGESAENVNIIGQYSSTLYDYEESLPIAVAANAKKREIGFEGFETIDPNCWIEQGQLMFSLRLVQYSESYPILGAWNPSLTPSQIWLDREFTSPQVPVSGVDIHLRDRYGEHFYGTSTGVPQIASVDPSTINPPISYFKEDFMEVELDVESSTNLPDGDYYGMAHVHFSPQVDSVASELDCCGDIQNVDQRPSNVILINNFGHTGTKSLYLRFNQLVFPQYELRLEKDHRYHVSLWVALDSNTQSHMPSFEDFVNLEIGNIGSDPVRLRATSNIIEGWQQFEANFEYTQEVYSTPEITFSHIRPIYIDDIRILPFEATMTTYVYDPSTYRLVAELDENNFSTQYFYDDEGALSVVKKETNRGLKTIQETKNYIRSHE